MIRAPAEAGKSLSSATDESFTADRMNGWIRPWNFETDGNDRPAERIGGRSTVVELDNMKYKLSGYEKPLQEVKESLDLENKKKRIIELDRMMEEPDCAGKQELEGHGGALPEAGKCLWRPGRYD